MSLTTMPTDPVPPISHDGQPASGPAFDTPDVIGRHHFVANAPGEPATGPTASKTPIFQGHQLVADMMRRQDDVLEQLDQLNDRIEAAIADISASRHRDTDRDADALVEAETTLPHAA